MRDSSKDTAESQRIQEDIQRIKNWKRWGTYLSERQWGTVREDYSATGECWSYFPHDHARSRAYRWGEDGLLGFCDREGRLCFSLALWNGKDPILKERLFGLSGPEGNHGEDVKEYYYYLASTPTHSYQKALYKYPQIEYPYQRLIEENRNRGRQHGEFELLDTGIFNENRYFDVFVEYAKNTPDDILIRIEVANRGSQSAELHLLPTVWFANTWSWGRQGQEGYWNKPQLSFQDPNQIFVQHESLGEFYFVADDLEPVEDRQFWFTENETNFQKLFNMSGPTPTYAKDAFHERLIHDKKEAINPERKGTKACIYHRVIVPGQSSMVLKLRLCAKNEFSKPWFGKKFDSIFKKRIFEMEEFFQQLMPSAMPLEERRIAQQALGGLLWTKQFYKYVVKDWMHGDPTQPAPDPNRQYGRNTGWEHLYNRDVLSVPDKWEYPWYAAWDLAFHMVAFSHLDPEFAKKQLILLLREWYMHPNGQLPAYEFSFSDLNPPVHVWACSEVYHRCLLNGKKDRDFLERTFQKLLLNFTWWINREDRAGNNLFQGGFLGLDNIGVFDRSKPLPVQGYLEQSDATAWMGFYCTQLLAMSFELSESGKYPAYADMASKFFEHFIAICDSMNHMGGSGLWDETDGFYYDLLLENGKMTPLKVRSWVGIIPLLAVEVLNQELVESHPGFQKRMNWFLKNYPELAINISCGESISHHTQRLLALPSKRRLQRILQYLLDEDEFLSPYGIRSVSKYHEKHPFVFWAGAQQFEVHYVPGESDSGLFGGNSNWRGPIWFPLNFLLIQALEKYYQFYGDTFQVECPAKSGQWMNLQQVAHEISNRLISIFLPNPQGFIPGLGQEARYVKDPWWKDLSLFFEYFHGETGKGLGASHQTGWTSVIVNLLFKKYKT
jgi:hypothetical protein